MSESSVSTTTKRSVSELDDDKIVTSEYKRLCLDEFERLIMDGSESVISHERNHVNLSSDQRCDVSKIYHCDSEAVPRCSQAAPLDDLIYGPVGENEICTTLEKYKNNNPDYDPNYVSNNFWTPYQYTKIEKINIIPLVSKLKEIKENNIICNIEYYEDSEPSDIAYLMEKGTGLIEKSGKYRNEKEYMYKKLFDRMDKGRFARRNGFVRKGDQTRDKLKNGILMFYDAYYSDLDKLSVNRIKIRKIKAITYKLTRYELI